MKDFLVIYNYKSGHSQKLNKTKIQESLGYETSVIFKEISEDKAITSNVADYSNIIVYGGDGTLNSVVAGLSESNPSSIFYVPTGTLNDFARTLKKYGNNAQCLSLGYVNGVAFNYVLAAGSFTDIGYVTKQEHKQKYKRLAYVFRAVLSYKVQRIDATVTANGNSYSEQYALIMYIKNRHCFGFPFNRLYQPNEKQAQLILITAPKGRFLQRFRMFFPFFRVFFMGIQRPMNTKCIKVISADTVDIVLQKPCDFCLDGERLQLDKELRIELVKTVHTISLIN